MKYDILIRYSFELEFLLYIKSHIIDDFRTSQARKKKFFIIY